MVRRRGGSLLLALAFGILCCFSWEASRNSRWHYGLNGSIWTTIPSSAPWIIAAAISRSTRRNWPRESFATCLPLRRITITICIVVILYRFLGLAGVVVSCVQADGGGQEFSPVPKEKPWEIPEDGIVSFAWRARGKKWFQKVLQIEIRWFLWLWQCLLQNEF